MENNKVNIINGAVVGVHLGAPMQDATPAKPEDNDVYATERNTVTRIPNSEEIWDEQPAPSGGVSSWDDIPDRPFGSEVIAIEKPMINADWDGNTDGRATYRVGMEDGYCYVSDIVVDDYHDLVGATIRYICDGESKLATLTEDMYYEWMFEEGGLRFYDDSNDSFEVGVAAITKEFDVGDTHFPVGLYFTFHESHGYVCNINRNNIVTTKEIITPIDVKYLPKSHQFGDSTEIGTLVDEITFTTNKQWGYYDFNYSEQLEVGREYQVIIDGMTYNCIAWGVEGYPQVYLGSAEVGGVIGGNGEPFRINSYPDGQLQFVAQKNTTYTLEILGEVDCVQTIDPKYLPTEVGTYENPVQGFYVRGHNDVVYWVGINSDGNLYASED